MRGLVRLEHAWILLTLAATFIGPASSQVAMLDLGWTLRSGQWMVEHGQLLSTDPFTTAPALPNQVDLQWLAQLIYFAFFRLGDLPLVMAANAAAISLAYGLVLAACVAACGRPRLACAAVVPAYLLGFTNLTPRPQTLAYPLFGLFLLLLVRAQRSGRHRDLWLLWPAMAIWVNVHGSFFVGGLLVGCFAAGAALEARSLRAAWPYAVALAGCLVAACLTPFGPGSLVYVVTIASNPIVRDFVGEWAPTSLRSTEGLLFFGSVLGVLALAWRRQLRATEMVVLVVFGCLGLTAVRSVIWWGMASAPVVARLLSSLVPPTPVATRERPWLNLAVVGLVLSLVLASLPWVKAANPLLPESQRSLVEQEVPPDLVEFLGTHTYSGLMLSHQGWGGYFDWTLWPEHQPFLDGRFELHPPVVWLDYMAITTPRADWQALADRYGIGYMVLWKRAEPGLIDAARATTAWRIDYEDDQAVVLVRA